MTIDPMLSLSFSMSATPGAYALLLGSGISRSAQIPTGWEITLELARKIAVANGEEVPVNPYEWYQKVYGAWGINCLLFLFKFYHMRNN